MSLRICHCILEPRYSGAEILVLGLVRAQIAAGASVAIFSLRPSESAFRPELENLERLGCQLFIPRKPLVRLQRRAWLKDCTRAFVPDVIFSHSLLPSVWTRLALLDVSRIRLITVLHCDNDFGKWEARLFERIFWRRNDAVVGVSAASLRNYRSQVTRKQSTRLISNGIDVKQIRDAIVCRSDVRRDVFKASSDDVVLLQVGRISPQKQQRRSIEALAALGQKIPLGSIRLFFAGVIEYKDYYDGLMSTARALGVDGRIEFLGSRTDIPDLLSGADACLMPSGWEGQSIAALEALAAGLYCIFSRLESFIPYEHMPGVVVLPPEGSIMQLCDSIEHAISSLALSRRYTRDLDMYSLEKCAQEYMEVATSVSSSKVSRA